MKFNVNENLFGDNSYILQCHVHSVICILPTAEINNSQQQVIGANHATCMLYPFINNSIKSCVAPTCALTCRSGAHRVMNIEVLWIGMRL